MTQVKAFIPHYKRDGNEVVSEFEETFYDRNGNKAILTKVIYRTKKGAFNQETIRVKWFPIQPKRPYSVKIISHNIQNYDTLNNIENHFILKNISNIKIIERVRYPLYHLIHYKSDFFKNLEKERLTGPISDGCRFLDEIYYHALIVSDINGNKTELRYFNYEKLNEAVKILTK